jgi:hypothetical protein
MNKSKAIQQALEAKGVNVESVCYLREPVTFKPMGYRVIVNDDSMPDSEIIFGTFDDAMNWAYSC